jgi:hypothetical protein
MCYGAVHGPSRQHQGTGKSPLAPAGIKVRWPAFIVTDQKQFPPMAAQLTPGFQQSHRKGVTTRRQTAGGLGALLSDAPIAGRRILYRIMESARGNDTLGLNQFGAKPISGLYFACDAGEYCGQCSG